MSLGLARVWSREAAGVQVPSATSLATNFSLRACRFAAECLGMRKAGRNEPRSPKLSWNKPTFNKYSRTYSLLLRIRMYSLFPHLLTSPHVQRKEEGDDLRLRG